MVEQRARVQESSSPVGAIEGAVLDGFAEMLGLNGVRSVEVRYGAGDFENAVVARA